MTIASLRRKWPKLIREAQKSMHLKFKRKPTLKISPGGRPRGETITIRQNGKVVEVELAYVTIPKRMVKANSKLAELCVFHELTEDLAIQNGMSPTKAHRQATKHTERYRKRIGSKQAGRLLSKHYGWNKKKHRLAGHWVWGK